MGVDLRVCVGPQRGDYVEGRVLSRGVGRSGHTNLRVGCSGRMQRVKLMNQVV